MSSAGVIIPNHISGDVYEDLKYYFQYASSAYNTPCAHPNGNTNVDNFSDTDTSTQGFVALDDARQEVVVAFRGSVDGLSYLDDVNMVPESFTYPGVTPPDGVKVHTGFLKAWKSVAKHVINVVTSQLQSHPDYTIVTSGHSLGGSISSLAAITLQGTFPTYTVRMYTYGQPRTGNPAYACWVNAQFIIGGNAAFRSTHANDSVPASIQRDIPIMNYKYEHHGVEYWQNPDPDPQLNLAGAAATVKCDAEGEDQTCSLSVAHHSLEAHSWYYGTYYKASFCK